MNILNIVKNCILGAALLGVIVVFIILLLSKAGVVCLIFLLISFIFLSAYKVIEIIQKKMEK